LRDSGNNNQAGWSLPIIWILLIVIGVLIYFFGWIVIIFVLATAGLITLGTYIHDKIVGPPGIVVYGDYDDDMDYRAYGISRDGKICKTCKSQIFKIVSGQTTTDQISKFAKSSSEWSQNEDALNGRMHAGMYCPRGCITIFAGHPGAMLEG